MHITRSSILHIALLWIAIVHGIPSVEALPREQKDGKRLTASDQPINVLQMGGFGAGSLFAGFLNIPWKKFLRAQPQTSIHQSSHAPRPHFKRVADLASHFETTEDWHSAMDCIESKLYAQTSSRQLRADYDDYFHAPHLLSEPKKQAVTDLIWECVDQVKAQAAERAKARGSQEDASKASEEGILRPGDAKERGSEEPARQTTGSEPAPRTGSQTESGARQQELAQEGPQKRPGFRTLRDLKAVLDRGDPVNEDKHLEDRYYQALHCINAKLLERNGGSEQKATEEFVGYFYTRGRLTPSQKAAITDIIWSCVNEAQKADQTGVRWRPLIEGQKKESSNEQNRGDNSLMQFAANAGKILGDASRIVKGNPMGGIFNGQVARPIMVP